MKKIIPLVLLAAAAAGGVYYWSQRPKDDPDHIKVSGNIEMTQVAVAFKTPGKVVELLVDEGAAVKKGDVVARLDRETITRQRGRDQAGVSSAESALAQLRTTISLQKETLESDIAMRASEIRSAESRLKDLLAGARPQEIQQAEAALRDARTQQEQARKDWERAEKLFKDEDISASQHDQFRTRYNSAQEIGRQADQRLSLIKEGPRKEEIEAARAQLSRAQAAMKFSEANRLEVRRKEQEVGARQAEVDRTRAQVSVIDSQIDETVAATPINGVVLVKSVDLGEVVNAGTPVMTIADTARPWLRGYITESQLGRVKLGSAVKITSDSFPGKTYAGKVAFISSEAEFTPKQIQTNEERVKLVYRIKVVAENPNGELKLNMPVDAVIEVK